MLPHKLSKTHQLVEFRSDLDIDTETLKIPKVVGCSIPRPNVTFDRKIKRSNLNVVISRSRLSTCSCVQWVPVPSKLRYRLRTGQRSGAALLIASLRNSTKSRQIDIGIYPDKALRRRIRLVTA